MIEKGWKEVLQNEFNSNYFSELKNYLLEEKKSYVIYPPGSKIFEAFNLTPFDSVKVVIIGQDPYHGAGQAHGLCFSVAKGVKSPPSLVNIFKELYSDLGITPPTHGNLEEWAKQGVLLLNSILTVRANNPASHQNQGWEKFTDAAIKAISEKRENVVFLLWGKFAQNKATLVNMDKHFILNAAHPSPFSAHNGSLGCKHFSKANDFLIAHGKSPVNWKIS